MAQKRFAIPAVGSMVILNIALWSWVAGIRPHTVTPQDLSGPGQVVVERVGGPAPARTVPVTRTHSIRPIRTATVRPTVRPTTPGVVPTSDPTTLPPTTPPTGAGETHSLPAPTDDPTDCVLLVLCASSPTPSTSQDQPE